MMNRLYVLRHFKDSCDKFVTTSLDLSAVFVMCNRKLDILLNCFRKTKAAAGIEEPSS